MWVTLHNDVHFVKGSLITSFPITNREWVTLHILWKAVSSYHQQQVSDFAHFVKQSHHIFSYDQQRVSDLAHSVNSILITSFPMTNRLWVTWHILWNAVSSHLFLLLTESEWHCTFVKCSLTTSFPMTNSMWVTLCERWESHHIFSYDQQYVSDIAHFVKHSLMPSFPVTNRGWVHCTFCKGSLITSFPMTNRLWVALHFVKHSLIASFPMTNSLWVTLHILSNTVSSHLFLLPTACEWHCTFCERYIFSYHQQEVSDIAHFVKGSLITYFPTTKSKWVILHIPW